MMTLKSNQLLNAAESNMETFTQIAHAYQRVLDLKKNLERYQASKGVSKIHDTEYDDYELATLNRINSGINIFAKRMFDLNSLFHSQTGEYIINDNVTPFWKKKELFYAFENFVRECSTAQKKVL